MPNPALTEKIRNLPPLLDSLERDAEVSDLLRRSDAPENGSGRCFLWMGWSSQRLRITVRNGWPAMSTTPTRSRDPR